MQQWFSAAGLAEMQLPGLPKDRKAVREMAKREAWQCRKRQGRGGGNEYHISALPSETQQHLYLQGVTQNADGSLAVEPTPPYGHPSSEGRSGLVAVDPRAVAWQRGDRLEVDGRAGVVDGFIGDRDGLVIWWDDDASHPFNVWFSSVSRVRRAPHPSPLLGKERGQDFDLDGRDSPVVADATGDRLPPVVATSPTTTPARQADREGFVDFDSRSVSSSAPLGSRGSGDLGSGSALAAVVRVSIPEVEPTELPKSDRVAIARCAYIQAQMAYCAGRGIPTVDCEYEFCEQLRQGLIAVYDWVKRLQNPPSRSSLCRWKTKARQEGLLEMAPMQRAKRGCVIDTNDFLRGFIIGLVCKWPHIKYTHIYRGVLQRFPTLELTEPTVRRWVQRWKAENHNQFALLTNPDDWKNRYLPAFGSYSEGVTALNDLWELDSTPADVMLADGRYAIVGCIDVYSRRAKLLVTKTSKAVAIVALLRRCILDWGVPRAVKTDNGKDYTAFHIEHTLQAIGIDHKLCVPFSPEQKPHVERFLGTFLHDFLELLPGYIGHSVSDRKKIESRKSFAERFGDKAIEVDLDLKTFQGFCDNWTEGEYAQAVHGGTGKTPEQMAAGQVIRKIADERQLDLLMAETATRIVQKKGIKIENRWFIAPELAGQIGNQVHLRLPEDAGRVYVFTDSTCAEFICVAEDPDYTGASRQVIARKAAQWKKQQREAVRSLRQLIESANLDELPIEVVESGRQAAAKIAALPGQAEQHALPAAAAVALDFRAKTQQPIPLTAQEKELWEQSQAPEPVIEAVENPDDRFYRCWQYTEQGIGDLPTEADLTWYQGRLADKRINQQMLDSAQWRWNLENPDAPKTQIPGTGGARAV